MSRVEPASRHTSVGVYWVNRGCGLVSGTVVLL